VRSSRPHTYPEITFVRGYATRFVSRAICSGCGIRLQYHDPKALGFVFTRSVADKNRAVAWHKKTFLDVYDQVVRECNEFLAAKLQNTDQQAKATEREVKAMWQGSGTTEESKPSLPETQRDDPSGLQISRSQSHHCLRCHELQFHHDRLPELTPHLPPPPSLEDILADIETKSQIYRPVLVIILDPVDFPLSFLSFSPPPDTRVLFVVNRADAFCARSTQMKHFQEYFENEIRRELNERKMDIPTWAVCCVSAKKAFKIKELWDKIVDMRESPHSNVYFLGNPPQHLTRCSLVFGWWD
jgi:hypothetical protein